MEVELYYKEKSVYDLFGEFWIPVLGFENKYEVSNFARVKSLYDNVGRRRDFILSQYEDEDGYLRVSIGRGTKNRMSGVHRIVCSSFHDNPEIKPHVNHKDGNKKNNLPNNVEWATNSENQKHAYDTGLKADCHAILNREQVVEISKSKKSLKTLSLEYGVTISAISLVKRGKNWSGVTGIKFEKIKMKRITSEIAKEIYMSNLKGVELARKYNITTVTVSEIKTGRTWSKVTNHGNSRA